MKNLQINLNGSEVHFSRPDFTVFVADVPNNDEFKALRDELSPWWFLYWNEGTVYGLPKVAGVVVEFGTLTKLSCVDSLRFLAARVVSVLPDTLPDREIYRRRPYIFRGGNDLVRRISKTTKCNHSLLEHFRIEPRFAFDAKVVELVDEAPFVGVFLSVRMRWETTAPLDELKAAGVDLDGLYAVLRSPEPGQRRLVGRIGSVSDGIVRLTESFDGNNEVKAGEVYLEGSRASFARCLKVLLGPNGYKTFEECRDSEEAQYYTGPALDAIIGRSQDFLVKKSPLDLGGGLSCTIGQRVIAASTAQYQSVIVAPRPEYCFDPARSKRSELAWSGLERFGPYSRDTFAKKSPKIVVFFPDTIQGQVENFLRQFRDGVSIANSRYAGGFASAYGLANPEIVLRKIPWLKSRRPSPGASYRATIEEYLTEQDGSYADVAIVALLDDHANLAEQASPYLQSKALLLTAGIPVQEVRSQTLGQNLTSLQYTLQNFSLQMYAKLNGTPWTVDHDLTINDELVIGMGTCELSGSRFEKRHRYVGITTVFRGDGNYLLSNISKECTYEQYPDVLRASTAEILRHFKQRNGWGAGDTIRLVVHAYKPLRNVEVADIMADCIKATCGEQNVEFAFVTVSHDHSFMMFDYDQLGTAVKNGQGVKGVFAPERGTTVQLGRYTRLLTTNSPSLIKRTNSPLPRPLLIHLHPGSTFGDQQYLAEQVLKFTSLSWRSTLPSADPVTIYYSELIAELLARLRSVPDWSPLMLNVKLRASRWFL